MTIQNGGLAIVLLLAGANIAFGQPPKKAKMELDKICDKLESDDSFAACELVESGRDSTEAADLYSNLVRHLYNERRDVPGMILMGRAGIHFCLTAAATTPEKAEHLKGMAKTIAYNMSVNAWPGWQDKGIKITRSDSIAGLDAAKLNLRLARELKRDDGVMGNAHWLLGAHLLALGERDSASERFKLSAESFSKAKKPAFEHMALGYVAIANQKPKELEMEISALKKIGGDDAPFFADQLKSVGEYFKER